MEYKRNECLKLFGIEMVTVRVFQCRNSTVGGEREGGRGGGWMDLSKATHCCPSILLRADSHPWTCLYISPALLALNPRWRKRKILSIAATHMHTDTPT